MLRLKLEERAGIGGLASSCWAPGLLVTEGEERGEKGGELFS